MSSQKVVENLKQVWFQTLNRRWFHQTN